MKKRILSLLLALVTVFYILPIGSIPAIATEEYAEDEGISVEDMEVGKLYSAKFKEDTFWPYAPFRFVFASDEGYQSLDTSVLDGITLTVVRKSAADVGAVYVADENVDWLGELSAYRYLYAADLDIFDENGDVIVWNEMTVGKEYSATVYFNATEVDPLRPMTEGEAFELVPYYYADPYSDGLVSTEGFPVELIIELAADAEGYVYVTNSTWPAEYDQYRYIDPSEDLIITGEIYPPKVTYRGEEVTEITLYEDGKMPLKAVKPEELTGEVEWTWEVLVDAANNTWARIEDKTTDVCNVTYALVVNVLDENGQAKIRTVVDDGNNQYKSEPVTVKTKFIPKPIEPEYENVTAANDEYIVHSAKAYADGDAGSTEIVTVTIEFRRVLYDGTTIKAYDPDTHQKIVGEYEEFSVPLPEILGYYAYGGIIEKTGDSYPAYPEGATESGKITEITVPAGLTSDVTYVVYYYPGQAAYTVIHYKQKIDSDLYDEALVETKYYTVDHPIPDVHYTATQETDEFFGFHHLYYEHAGVASDNSTVIKVYYDRDYLPVIFHLDKKGAYGQDNLLVKYETTIGVNIPVATGWTFSGWQEVDPVYDSNGKVTSLNPAANPKYADFTAAPRYVQPKITSAVDFLALWYGLEAKYTVIYWLENANDGNYSVWETEEKHPTTGVEYKATAGTLVKWHEIITDAISEKDEYEFATLNTTKTESEWIRVPADNDLGYEEGVKVEGDGSTTVNVYFNRRVYNIDFHAAANSSITHVHGDGNCQYTAMYCTDPTHLDEHTHTDECGELICGVPEHMHTAECCDAHVHEPKCYQTTYNKIDGTSATTPENIELATSIQNMMREYVKDDWGLIGSLIDRWFGETITNTGTDEANKILTMAYPKNLQNGYVYVTKIEDVPFNYLVTTKYYDFDIVAIYIDGKWYHYRADLTGIVTETAKSQVVVNGQIQEIEYNYFIADTTTCQIPDHDHTSGCTYGTTCTATEHVHTNKCYASCLEKATPQHNADCFGNVCSIPTYVEIKDNEGNITDQYSSIQIQAKYGQDITALLPYYLELTKYGLHQNSSDEYFTGWTYAGTGWADPGKVRYVKHVTMVDELCYSEGVIATGQYASNVTPYVLYYMFESFDTTSEAVDYDENGAGRVSLSGVWYDSDPHHAQIIMLDNDDDDALAQLLENGNKEIEGMTIHTGVTNPVVNNSFKFASLPDTTFTQYVYFYDRKTITSIVLHNNSTSDVMTTLTTDKNGGVLKYGVPYKNLAVPDNDSITYPGNLEPGGYYLDGWYTTPFAAEYTKVDLANDLLYGSGSINLYALWLPVTHEVKIYESYDGALIPDTNNGTQHVSHRSYLSRVDEKLTSYGQNTAIHYTFAGWFYVDSKTGTEMAFDFNFPITQDMEIYAKWAADVIVPYRVNYVVPYEERNVNYDVDVNNIIYDEYGEPLYLKIADTIEGEDLAGLSRTFRAMVGNELYPGYQDHYYPEYSSHTLHMDAVLNGEGNGFVANEFNFIYEHNAHEVGYLVRYLDATTRAELEPPVEKVTHYSSVSELFKPILGYTVDKYAKTIVLTLPTLDDDENYRNVIEFLYTENEAGDDGELVVTAPWKINHKIQNLDGTYSVYTTEAGTAEIVVDRETGEVKNPELVKFYFIGSNPAGIPLEGLAGYEFASALTDVNTRTKDNPDEEITLPTGWVTQTVTVEGTEKTQYGYPLNIYGVTINLYYVRTNVGYTVEYRDIADDLSEPSLSIDGAECEYEVPAAESTIHGEEVEVPLNEHWNFELMMLGYELVDTSVTSITKQLHINEEENRIIFYYQKIKRDISYQIVCPDADSGVSLDNSRDTLTANGLDDGGHTMAPLGSAPNESTTHYFVGWYKDEACTIPVDTTTDPAIIDSDNRLIPTKTVFAYTDSNGVTKTGELYIAETYYAKFLPRAANVQITVTSGQSDSFILTFTGTEGTALGETFTVAVIDGVAIIVSDVKIGKYTVTANSDWSWRYGAISGELTVSPVVSGQIGGTLSLTVTPTEDQWLTDDASGTVTPTVTP